MDIRLALIAGADIPIPSIRLTLHQPTIKEYALMGESDLFQGIQYLCINKNSLVQENKSETVQLNNFQLLMKILEQSENKHEKKNIISTLLSFLFPSYNIALMPRSIVFMQEGQENIMIDENNFEELQSVLNQVLCVNKLLIGDQIIYKPANDDAKRIADKIMKGRQKVAELKSQEEGNNDSILGRYISILTIGVHSMAFKDCLDLTLYQLFDLVDRFTLYTQYDIDLRVRLAGGTPDKEAENWMKGIH